MKINIYWHAAIQLTLVGMQCFLTPDWFPWMTLARHQSIVEFTSLAQGILGMKALWDNPYPADKPLPAGKGEDSGK
jgi:hypothetical protein